jgi:tetratricopeptide (TPR) repeat protein
VFESWERARAIVSEHKEFFRIRDEVEGQRKRWMERGRPKAMLLAKGVPLAEAQKIVKNYGEELPKELRTYVTMSNRRAQRFNVFMGATAAVFACLFVAASVLWFEAGRAEATAKTSYQAAKGAVIDLVGAAIESLQDIQGIRVATVQRVLAIVDKTIRMVQDVSVGDAELARARAKMQFQAGKTFQKKEEHAQAVSAANESYAIRASLTNFDNAKPFPLFQSTPREWRWELSQSLELMGDLFREEKNFQDARDWFEKTLAVRRDLMAQAPDVDDWAHGVSQTFTRLGDLDFSSNLAAALQNYESSLAIAAKYFLLNTEADRWQRELSWGFNKIGDVKVRTGDVKVKVGELANPDYVAALEAFTNSLCLRRRNSGRDPSRTELARDVSYSLERIGGAKAKLDDREGAQTAYFEALAIRRRVAAGVPDNALYQGDVAASLQLIGEYYARNDLKLALAFYDAAADLRLEITVHSPEDKRARINLEVAQKKAADVRQLLAEKYTLEDFSDHWWRKPVADAERAFAKRAIDLDSAACMETVTRSIDQLIGPKTTANIRQ